MSVNRELCIRQHAVARHSFRLAASPAAGTFPFRRRCHGFILFGSQLNGLLKALLYVFSEFDQQVQPLRKRVRSIHALSRLNSHVNLMFTGVGHRISAKLNVGAARGKCKRGGEVGESRTASVFQCPTWLRVQAQFEGALILTLALSSISARFRGCGPPCRSQRCTRMRNRRGPARRQQERSACARVPSSSSIGLCSVYHYQLNFWRSSHGDLTSSVVGRAGA